MDYRKSRLGPTLIMSHSRDLQRVIVRLFSKRHTECEWQHWVSDAAGTFASIII